MTIQMKQHKVVLTLTSVDEILVSDHSIKAIDRTVYYETKRVLPKNLVQ